MGSELGSSQISTLLETLPGIATVLRSPVADALSHIIRAAARLDWLARDTLAGIICLTGGLPSNRRWLIWTHTSRTTTHRSTDWRCNNDRRDGPAPSLSFCVPAHKMAGMQKGEPIYSYIGKNMLLQVLVPLGI